MAQQRGSKTASNSVHFELGTESFLTPLFEFYPQFKSWDKAKSEESPLLECLEHAFTITLLRDQFYGAWAHVWREKGKYHLKITSPTSTDDVTGYAELIPRFLEALALARKAFDEAVKMQKDTPAAKVSAEQNLRFLPPIGLAMRNARSVLLLHYPPKETIDYLDYLHSRTTKRWESLLISNGHPGADNPLLESIVDVYPVTADGGSVGSTAVDKLCEQKTIPEKLAVYAGELLSVLLQQDHSSADSISQPLVALGGAVRKWLFKNPSLKSQMEKQLKKKLTKPSEISILATFSLEFKKGLHTPVLIMDHPCNFYRGVGSVVASIKKAGNDKAKRKAAEDKLDKLQKYQLKKDLIGARWQVVMSQNRLADPQKVLQDARDYWDMNQGLLEHIARNQVLEFQNIACSDEC